MLEDKLRRLSAEDATSVDAPTKTEDFITKLKMGFLVEMIDFSRTFQTVFERRSPETKKLLEEFARELLGKYFQVVRAKLAVH